MQVKRLVAEAAQRAFAAGRRGGAEAANKEAPGCDTPPAPESARAPQTRAPSPLRSKPEIPDPRASSGTKLTPEPALQSAS